MKTPSTAVAQFDAVTHTPAREDNWVVFTEDLLQRPALNADILITSTNPTAAQMALRFAANRNWEVAGTNMTTALCTFADGGGVVLTTAGADADQGILQPHLDTNQTALAATKWNTSDECAFDVEIKTGASIADAVIWAGFKLTNTGVVATDNDQAFFRFATATNSGGFQLISSYSGTDETISTGVVLAASTVYRLQIKIDVDRVPRYYVNGAFVGQGHALTADVDLKPYVGVQASAAAAKAITVRAPIRLGKVAND